MLSQQLPLGLLTDLAAYALPLGTQVKCRLLAESQVSARARILLEQVEKLAAASGGTSKLQPFPPKFSEN
jgi:hypothetical protein